MVSKYSIQWGVGDVIKTLHENVDGLPVLDVFNENNLLFQLGFNQSHLKKEVPSFEELKSSENPSEILTEDQTKHTLESLLSIFYSDTSLSDFSFLRKNSFNIHTSDKGIQSYLNEEIKRHSLNQCYNLLLNNEFGISSDWSVIENVIEDISKNSNLFIYFFSFVNRRSSFLEGAVELSKKSIQDKDYLKNAQKIMNGISDNLKELSEYGVNDSRIKKAIELTKLPRQRKILSEQKMRSLFEIAKDIPQIPYDSTEKTFPEPSMCYSDVKLLNSTLHKRSNKGYSDDILTYKLTEPNQNYYNRIQLAKK